MCNLQSAVYRGMSELACNLFWERAAVAKGNSVKFSIVKCWSRNPSGNLCGTGLLVGKLYQVYIDCEPVSAEHSSVALKQHSDLNLWHQRSGHLNAQHFKEAIQKKLVNDVEIQTTAKLSFCEGCVEGDNLSSQWEKYAQPESSSWYTVMYVDQCLLSQLVVGNILLHLLMITHDDVESNINRVSSIHYSCRFIQSLLW